MKNVYYIKEDKAAVQDFYVDIIANGLIKAGYPNYKTITIDDICNIDNNSVIICISHYAFIRLWLKGFRNIIYWVQGTSPDESFMRNRSYIRKWIISVIEYIALQKAKFIFMVSQGMLQYYKKKYHKDYSYKTYVMPCYNSNIQEALFMTPDKYKNNTFCYVGGLSIWQCFSETVALYKQIEDKLPNTIFKVFTSELDKARYILESYGVKKYDVKFVNPNQLVRELASCKFGFIVRSESPVNFVATPTKLSNYMAAGLIPIVSNTVSFFEEILRDSENAVIMNGELDVEKIISIAEREIDAKSVLNDFRRLFNIFYNNDTHINNISQKIQKIKL